MHPVTQLLLRHTQVLGTAGPALWINPPPDASWRELGKFSTRLTLFCQDFADWRVLSTSGARVQFGDFPEPPAQPLQTLLLTLPREKQRLSMMLQLCTGLLDTDGSLWVVGENQSGIKSCGAHLEQVFQLVRKADSARHCGLFIASRPRTRHPFDAGAWIDSWSLQEAGLSLKLCSLPGVFSHGSLDDGTRMLLQQIPDIDDNARVLDFACGAGVIGAALLRRQPGLQMTFLDSSALALAATRATLAANGLQGRVLASDGFSELEGRFDLILSNPPFHQGHRSVLSLSPALLNPIGNFLSPGGQLIMVANRHLPYRRWLDTEFQHHDVLASDNRFHVLRVRQQHVGTS